MKDYSTYHIDIKSKILEDGIRNIELAKDGFDGIDVLVNGTAQRVIMYDKYSTTWTWKNVIDLRGNLKFGDIIETPNDTWLIVRLESENIVYQKWIAEKCNSNLKWIDENGAIRSYPCIFYFNTKSNFGVEEKPIMVLPDGRRQVVVQNNEHTRKLNRSKRFIFGGVAYKVIDFDTVSDPGLVNLSLEEDQIKSTDNLDLGIADYFSNISNYTIEIANGENLTVEVGSYVQINTFVRKDGIIVNEELTYFSSDETIAIVDENGLVSFISEGQVVITVSLKNNNNISNTIIFNVQSVVADNYSIALEGPDEIKYGQSKQYKATVYNNGVIVDKEVVFELFSDDMILPTQLAKIVSQENNVCTIKNNNYNSGYVQLRAFLLEDPSVEQWKRVQMKPLF